jgi:hypothetical protein
MGPLVECRRQNKLAICDKKAVKINRHTMGRCKNPVIVADRDQSTVKQPVCGAAQSQSVSHRIGPIRFYGSDMRSLHFGVTTSIDQAQPRQCAPVVICLTYMAPENQIPEFP